jgi:MIP family channel proteins
MRKRYLAELVGSFVIVFAPVALSATSSLERGASGLLPAALVSGLSVLAMIYTFGPISAAHFNPAVTLGFAAARRFPWRFVVPYVAAQFAGAVLAAGLVALLFGGGHGVHVPSSDSVARNLGTEVVLAFVLMLVIIAVATDRRVSSTTPAIAIGLSVVFLVLIGGPVTGGSMNPARSFGPAIIAGGPALTHLWLYLVAPPIGAVLAALLFEALRVHHDEAKGAPNELLDALQSVQMESSRD